MWIVPYTNNPLHFLQKSFVPFTALSGYTCGRNFGAHSRIWNTYRGITKEELSSWEKVEEREYAGPVASLRCVVGEGTRRPITAPVREVAIKFMR